MLAAALALLCCAGALAAGSGEGYLYYVAGNPDCYPLEYYDAALGGYRGVLPALYAQLGEAGGIEFRYLAPSAKDRRLSFASNRQTELVSAIGDDEQAQFAGLVRLSAPVLRCTVDGREYSVRVGFTDIAPQAVTALVNERLAALTAQERIDSLVAQTLGQKAASASEQRTLVYALGAALALALLGGAMAVAVYRRRLLEQRRGHYTDPASKMGNRVYFDAKYNGELDAGKRAAYCLLVLSVDLIRVEQYASRAAAEHLLWQLGETFLQQTTQGEFFARIDDDAFALVLGCVSRQALEQRVDELGDALYAQLDDDSVKSAMRLRCGACFLSAADAQSELSLRRARRALQLAVDSNALLQVCDRQMLAELDRESELRRMLSTALRKEEFITCYQPILDAASGAVAGMATLVRWQHPQEGLLAPGFYVPLLEKDGMITQLDFYVLRRACRFAVRNRLSADSGLFIKVNFSRWSIGDPRFLERFRAVLSETGADAGLLVLNLTKCGETTGIPERENLRALLRMGVRLFMDDFGGSVSTLSDFGSFGFSGVNMRQALLQNMATPEGRQLIANLIDLGHTMHMRLLCNGLETQEQADFLRQVGCDYLQGCFYSYELPEPEAEKLLLEHRASASPYAGARA